MNNIKNALIQQIISGHYKEAKATFFDIMSEKDFYNVVISLAFAAESIAVYTFICFLIIEHESAYLHQLAAVLIKFITFKLKNGRIATLKDNTLFFDTSFPI